MSHVRQERVLEVEHFTPELFRVKTSRSPVFRFRAGQFTMLGLPDLSQGRPLLRAYSMASASYDEYLEFFSVKVPGGPLTSRLKEVRRGDELLVSSRATGTLVLGNLLAGRTLWLLATGTGLAPFMSVLKEPETFERFERVVLIHSVRRVQDLAYRDFLERGIFGHELVGELAQSRFHYVPTVTREKFRTEGRILPLLRSRAIERIFELGALSPEDSRVMLCGNPTMLEELKNHLEQLGFVHGGAGEPGHYLTERAFAP
jgi:ferredoxin/flavodoxin---NADP+ reductase